MVSLPTAMPLSPNSAPASSAILSPLPLGAGTISTPNDCTGARRTPRAVNNASSVPIDSASRAATRNRPAICALRAATISSMDHEAAPPDTIGARMML